MKVISSVWMISHPCFKEMSCILPDGSLNEERITYFAKLAKGCGANGMRILPGLLVDKKLFPNEPDGGYNYLPWKYDEKTGLFDLYDTNPKYFLNLWKLGKILKGFDLTLIFSMYDRCHWNNIQSFEGKPRIKSPWIFNSNNIRNMYHDNGNTTYHDTYERLVIDSIKDSKVDSMYEFANEPRIDNSILIPFCKRIRENLLRNEVKPEQLISGLEWFRGDKCNPDYGKWRRLVEFQDNDYKGVTGGYAVVHGFQTCYRKPDVLAAQAHTRKFFMSTDGSACKEQDIEKILMQYFGYKAPGKNKAVIWIFEGLYFGFDSDRYVSRGIANAIHQYFGFWPGEKPDYDIENKLMDPGNPPQKEIKPPPPPPPPPEKKPEPEKPVKQTFWKWLHKNRRFILGLLIIGGTIAATAVKWWLVVPGLLLNHGLWHFRIFK